MANQFFWYELMTSDVKAAEAFYSAVIGWTTTPFEGSAHDYTVVNAGDRGVGGLMTLPPEAAANGMKPCWIGYVHVTDIDAKVAEVQAAGGKLHKGPDPIPTVGRFAVVSDPQGAMFNMLQPEGPDMPAMERGTIGKIDWNELHSSDWESGYEFYAKLFGWSKTTSMDMGPMGTYQLFSMGSDGDDGGMMNLAGEEAKLPPYWGFYVSVDAAEAAAERIRANGGTVLMGPHEVPGPSYIVTGMDPQGAMFSVVAPKL